MNNVELMRVAFRLATASPDPSTQNGALLATPDGSPIAETFSCNEFPRGVTYTAQRWERPGKYQFIEHAERNSIFSAAFHGVCTAGLVMVCPWAACADCARAIIQVGIEELVTLPKEKDATNDRWDSSISSAMTMLYEAGVKVTYLLDPLGPVSSLRRNGVLWVPESAEALEMAA